MLIRVQIVGRQGGGPWLSANVGEIREREVADLTMFGITVPAKDLERPGALETDPVFQKMRATGEANGIKLLAFKFRAADKWQDFVADPARAKKADPKPKAEEG